MKIGSKTMELFFQTHLSDSNIMESNKEGAEAVNPYARANKGDWALAKKIITHKNIK